MAAEFLSAIPPDSAGLAAVSARLAAWLHAAGVAEAGIGRVELVLEEVVMNVIMHGARPDGLATRIQLAAALAAEGCRLRITDNAPAFDPVTTPPPRETASLEDDPGGLGLALLRRYTRAMHYERLADGNQLALTIPLAGG